MSKADEIASTFKYVNLIRKCKIDFYRDLQRLNLGKNRLTAVPHMALASLTYLERLDLFENELTELKPGDFNGKHFIVDTRQ